MSTSQAADRLLAVYEGREPLGDDELRVAVPVRELGAVLRIVGERGLEPSATPDDVAAWRPLPTPLDRLKAAARELRALPAESRRLHIAVATMPPGELEHLDPTIAKRLLEDAARIGTAILEHAELVGMELAEVASHSHRYAADRTAAEAALRDIRHLTETVHERHSAVTLSSIESILDEAGIQ